MDAEYDLKLKHAGRRLSAAVSEKVGVLQPDTQFAYYSVISNEICRSSYRELGGRIVAE